MKMIDINKELGITSIDFNNMDMNNNTEDNIDDFFKETLDDLDKFDEKAWKKLARRFIFLAAKSGGYPKKKVVFGRVIEYLLKCSMYLLFY